MVGRSYCRPIVPPYYIEDCQISSLLWLAFWWFLITRQLQSRGLLQRPSKANLWHVVSWWPISSESNKTYNRTAEQVFYYWLSNHVIRQSSGCHHQAGVWQSSGSVQAVVGSCRQLSDSHVVVVKPSLNFNFVIHSAAIGLKAFSVLHISFWLPIPKI